MDDYPPPNILLIHGDQHRFDCLGVNGHPLLETPNLDRIAAEGVNFTHAFTPAPICSPARASLATGAWPTQHGCINLPGCEGYRPVREDLPLITEVLNEAGYRIGYVGKFGGETAGPPSAHGAHDYVPLSEYPKWRHAQGLPPLPHANGYFGEADPHIRPEQSRLAWSADHVLRLLDAYSTHDGPFFVRWDPVEPHPGNVVPEPYASMYPPGAIPPRPSFPDPLTNKPWVQRQQRRSWGVDEWTWDDWAPIVGRYLGEIALLDAQVGRVLGWLDERGLAENTLVIFTADHGDMCGAHGMFDKHYVLYDDVARVPLLLRYPAALSPGRTCDAFVCQEIDVARTLCDAAGIDAPLTFAGHSLLPWARGETHDARPDIFAMYQGTHSGLYSQRMVRDRAWKYVWNATAEDELYDLIGDPAELHNRAEDPAAREHLERLRRRLLAWMGEIRDPLLNAFARRQIDPEAPVPGF